MNGHLRLYSAIGYSLTQMDIVSMFNENKESCVVKRSCCQVRCFYYILEAVTRFFFFFFCFFFCLFFCEV